MQRGQLPFRGEKGKTHIDPAEGPLKEGEYEEREPRNEELG